MADKKTLRGWFENGKKPTQEQFWEWMDSYFHILDLIPISSIAGINEILLGKADSEALANLALWVNDLEDMLTQQNFIEKVDFKNPKLVFTFKDGTIQEIKLPTPETYGVLENGGLEINEDNQFSVKEKGITELMLDEDLAKKIKEAGGNLQNITDKGSETTQPISVYRKRGDEMVTIIDRTTIHPDCIQITEQYNESEPNTIFLLDKQKIIVNEAELSRDASSENLRFGKNTLKFNTPAKNTAIGDNALSENQKSPENTAIGYNTLAKLNGAGDWNTAVGAGAGQVITDSTNATLVGAGAAPIANKTNRDTFIGAAAAYSYTGEERDNGLGSGIMQSGQNTFVGDLAGYKMGRGFGNTFIGARSGVYFAYGGAFNTFLGHGITGWTANSYGSNNVVIGANASCNGFFSNKLIIHAQPDKANGGSFATDNLITGDFVDRWFKLAGKYVLNYKYTPDANKEPVEGETPFIPAKMLVADESGNVGVQKIYNPEAPITSQFLFTKKYYSTFFTHAFTSTSEKCYIKIQDAKPGNVNNLTIKGRIIVFEAYQDFLVTVKLDYEAFGSCWLKTSKSEDLIEELGFFYYDQGQVVFWVHGNTKYSNQHTFIIIDEITAFEGSTDLMWKDEPITELKNIDENLVNETISAQIIY